MNKLNFQWRENKGQFQSGESLYLGRIRVGNFGWNPLRSQSKPRDETKNYVGSSTLPQMSKPVYGETEEVVKSKIERQVVAWLREVSSEL